MRDKRICLAFKFDFLQLICKASLILKSNLELALSIDLKERELYESPRLIELQLAQVNLYIRIDFKSSGIES